MSSRSLRSNGGGGGKRKHSEDLEDQKSGHPCKRPSIARNSPAQSSSSLLLASQKRSKDALEFSPATLIEPGRYQTTNNCRKAKQSETKDVCIPCCVTPSFDLRFCTLPKVSFASSDEVWKLMCRQDECDSLDRDPKMLERHNGLQVRMRAILLDWLIEVCEVYKLQRETFYLAVDYLDRFLSTVSSTIGKSQLQLIGITCLFIAAKVEEIYPPKLSEFAYVTDGACTEEDILQEEMIILATLQWYMNPITAIGWLNIYMQINAKITQQQTLSHRRRSTAGQLLEESSKFDTFVYPIYPQFYGMEFAQAAQLLDLCTLDVEMANFPYSYVAAASLLHVFDEKTALRLSGLEWTQIAPCVRWMEPFYQAIKENCSPLFLMEQNDQVSHSSGLGFICPNVVTDESHTIQTHTISLVLFDKVMAQRALEATTVLLNQEESPTQAITSEHEGFLTPPASDRKTIDSCCSFSTTDNSSTKANIAVPH